MTADVDAVNGILCVFRVGWDRTVSITTCYWLDDLGIEAWW